MDFFSSFFRRGAPSETRLFGEFDLPTQPDKEKGILIKPSGDRSTITYQGKNLDIESTRQFIARATGLLIGNISDREEDLTRKLDALKQRFTHPERVAFSRERIGKQREKTIAATEAQMPAQRAAIEAETQKILPHLKGLQGLPDLNRNFFSNVHLDAIALNTKYEGLPQDVPVNYMQRLLQSPQLKALFSKPEILDSLSQNLSQLQTTANNIRQATAACQREQYEPVKQLAKEVAEAIYRLPPGARYLMPGGWAGEPGHAMYYEFIKLESGAYDVYLYNAGAGSESHAKEHGLHETKVAPFTYYKAVPPNKLFLTGKKGEGPISSALFEGLLLLQAKPIHEPTTIFNYDSVERCFVYLSPLKSLPDDRAALFFISGQRSGSCTVKSLNALLYSDLRRRYGHVEGTALYKELIYYSKLLSLSGEYERVKGALHEEPEKRYQLACAARFILRRTARIQHFQEKGKKGEAPISPAMQQAGIQKAREILGELEKIEKSVETERAAKGKASFQQRVAGSTSLPSLPTELAAQVSKVIAGLPAASVQVRDNPFRPPPSQSMEIPQADFSTPEGITTHLETVLKRATDIRGRNCSHFALDAAGYTSRVLSTIPLPSESNGWSRLSKEQALQILSQIKDFRYVDFQYLEPLASSNIAITLALLAFHCARAAEPELLGLYCLDFTRYGELQADPDFLNSDPVLFARRQELLSYMNSARRDKTPLFDFNEERELPSGFPVGYYPKKEALEKNPLHEFYRALLAERPLQESEKLRAFSEKIRGRSESRLHTQMLYLIGGGGLEDISPALGAAQGIIFGSQRRFTIAQSKLQETRSKDDKRLKNQAWDSSHHLSREYSRPENCSIAQESFDLEHNKELQKWVTKEETQALIQLKRAFAEKETQPWEFLSFVREHQNLIRKPIFRKLLGPLLFHPHRNANFQKYEPISNFEEVPLFELFQKLSQFKESDTRGFWHLARTVISEGLNSYCLGRKNEEPELDETFWFIELSQQLRIAYLRQTGQEAPELIPNEKELLKRWLSREDYSDDQKKNISQLLLQHYRQRPASTYSLDDLITITACSFANEPKDTPTSIWKMELAERLQALPEEKRRTLAEGVLKTNRYPLPLDWRVTHDRLVVTFENMTTKDWVDVNLHAGSIEAPGWFPEADISREKGAISENKKLFGDRKLVGCRVNQVYHFEDKLLGKMQLYPPFTESVTFTAHPAQLYRQIGDKMYRYLPLESLKKLKIPKVFLNNYSFWVPHDPANPSPPEPGTLILTNYKTGSNDYQWNLREGSKGISALSAKIPDRDDLATLSNDAFLSVFSSFEDPSWIVLWKKKPNERSVEFSRIRNQRGEGLTLVSFGEEWALSHNNHYKLTSLPEGHPLGAFKEALCFEDKKTGKYKFLLPYKPLESIGYSREAKAKPPQEEPDSVEYLEYEWTPGQEVKSPNPEAALYLSQLLLLQKDYEASLHYLKQEITRSYPLTERAEEILKNMFAIKDRSPNCCAVLLQAYIRAKQIDPFRAELFASLDLWAIYQVYRQDLSLRHTSLQLSRKEELSVLDRLPFDRECENRKKELLGERVYLSAQVFPPPSRKSADWDEVSSFNELPAVGSRGEAAESILKSRKELPSDYDELDLKVHFKACYEIFRNDAVENQPKRRELAYSIMKLASALDTEKRKAPENLVKILFYLYKDPERFPDGPPYFSGDFTELTRIIERLELDKPQAAAAPRVERETLSMRELPIEALPTASPQMPSPQERGVDLKIEAKPVFETPTYLTELFLEVASPSRPGYKAETALLPYGLATPAFAITAAELTPAERVHQKQIEEECGSYTEDCRQGAIKQMEEKSYRLQQWCSLKQFKEDVQAAREGRERFCNDLESHLLKSVKRLSNLPEVRRRQQIEEGSGISPKVRMIDLIRASLQPNVKEREKAFRLFNYTLTSREIQELRGMTLLYMKERVYTEQLTRTLEPLEQAMGMGDPTTLLPEQRAEYEYLCQTAYAALAAPRHYDVDENPEALLFEYLSGLQVRPVQAELIQRVLRDLLTAEASAQNFSSLFQLTMGGGKTSVILSQLIQYTSKAKRVPLFLCHHSQFNAVIGNFKEFQQQRFGQELVRIDYTREQLSDVKVLEHIHATLQEAQNEGLALIMKTPMVQIFQLEFLSVREAIFKASGDTFALEARAKELQKILSFIKTQCVGILDEAHLNLNLSTGVHFPLGRKCLVAKERIELVKGFYQHLATDPQLKELIKLRENRQAELTSQEYQEQIPPNIARYLVRTLGSHFQTEEQKNDFFEYLLGNVNPAAKRFRDHLKRLYQSGQEEDQQKANLAATAKQLLQRVLPSTLAKSYNRNYGRAPKGSEQVIPYQGVGIPATTEFANTNESLCYSFQSALNGGIQEQQLRALIQKMTTEAETIVKSASITFRDTAPAREFFSWAGVHLDEVNDPRKFAAAKDAINRDPKKQLAIEAKTGAQQVSYHEYVLSSDPFALIGQLLQVIACTGTPDESTLPLELRQRLLLEEGTEGRIINKLLSDAAAGKSRVLSAPVERDLSLFLTKTLGAHPEKDKVQALVDTGAFFRNFKNNEVADAILRHYQEDPRIKGVLFYQRDPTTGEEGFFIKKKGSDALYPLRNTQKEEVERYGLRIEDLFIYYDELRCTGTDIPPKPPDAIYMLTADPHRMTARDALQGAFRARGLFARQRVDFVVDEATKGAFLGKEELPSAANIMRTLIKNQALSKVRQTPQAYFGQVKNRLRQEGINEVLAKNDAATYAKWREHLLTPAKEEEGFERYGELEEEAKTVMALEAEAKETFVKFSTIPGHTKEQGRAFEASLQRLVGVAKQERFLPDTMMRQQGDLAGGEIEISREVATAVEVQSDVEVRAEVEREVQSWNYSCSNRPYEEKKELSSGISMAERFACQKGPQDKKDYALCFQGSKLQISKNQAQVVIEGLLHPLHELSQAKSARYLLITPGENPSYRLISESEAGEVMSSGGREGKLLTIGGISAIPGQSVEMTRELAQVLWDANFFEGNLSHLSKPEEIERTRALLVGEAGALRRRYLKLRSFHNPLHNFFFNKDTQVT